MTARIGAYHADAWSGLVLSRRPGEGFAFRFAVERAGGTVDLDDFFWILHEAGPHDPAGRYARVAFDLDLPPGRGADTPVVPREGRRPGLVLEWGRTGDATAVGRVRAGFEGALLLRAYFPWDWDGRWRHGRAGVLEGESSSGRSRATIRVDAAGGGPAWERADAPAGEAALRLVVRPGTEARFVAFVTGEGDEAGDDPGYAARAGTAPVEPAAPVDPASVDPGAVPGLLDAAARSYDAERTRVTGRLGGLAAAVTDNLHWMVLLQPETGRRYTPAGRRWIFPRAEARGGGRDHWTVFGWDSFFNALELDLEAPDAARETLLAGLRTAYPNGCVPNWRGRFGGTPDRSQPPLASLAALKLHLRRPDRRLLEEAYPYLAAWSRWWVAERDGRPRRAPGPRGLLTWGSDQELLDPLAPPWEVERADDVRQLAGWESGQDDLPTWDEAEPAPGSGCLALDPVDLNAYRVLDLECLARIAGELGRADESAAHRRAADRLRALVNEHLWDERRQSYADRRWDGAFTACRTASHFLVLAAGIPDGERAARVVEHLTDPGLFWGDHVIPTISRDDPRFPSQQYWRGTIWPPVNYLVRLGLARYGFDAVAGEVAARGADLFLDAWRRTGLCRENFDSRTGQGGGQRHQSWGPLFALAALEEMADVDPWHGLRLGGLRAPGESELRNLDLGPRGRWSVTVGPDRLRAEVAGRLVVESRGAVVLRDVRSGPDRFSADASCEGPVELRVSLAGTRWSARVEGRREELERPVLRLPPGRHGIEVRALE